jgi:hypothetical protein
MNQWLKANIQKFWTEVAPCDQIVQVYENETVFYNTLEGFAGDGILKKEKVVIIATPEHLQYLERRMRIQKFDIDQLKKEGLYITMEAEKCLNLFSSKNKLNKDKFLDFILPLVRTSESHNHKVRIFSEMVALLWAKGALDARQTMVEFWKELLNKNCYCIYCAYPKSGFLPGKETQIQSICDSYSKVIDGHSRPSTEIYYKAVH